MTEDTPNWAYEKAREVALSLPPSDFASHRAVKAFAAALMEERANSRVSFSTHPDQTSPMTVGPEAFLDPSPMTAPSETGLLPWKLEINEKSGIASILAPRGDGNNRQSDGYGWIAEVPIYTRADADKCMFPDIDPEAKANAELIVAAVNMHRCACATVVAEAEVGEPSENVMNAYWNAKGGTLGGVRAAIAEYLKERAITPSHAALLAEVERLRAALKPFAAHSKANADFVGTEEGFAVHVTGWKRSERSRLTVADFRRARFAFASISQANSRP